MKQKHILSLVQENMTTVDVRFLTRADSDLMSMNTKADKTYTYKVHTDQQIESGNMVIVEKNGKFLVVQVVEVHEDPQIDTDSDIDYKWVVQKIDTARYERVQAAEKEFLANLRKIETKKARNQAVDDFKEMFANDETSRMLLDQTIDTMKSV